MKSGPVLTGLSFRQSTWERWRPAKPRGTQLLYPKTPPLTHLYLHHLYPSPPVGAGSVLMDVCFESTAYHKPSGKSQYRALGVQYLQEKVSVQSYLKGTPVPGAVCSGKSFLSDRPSLPPFSRAFCWQAEFIAEQTQTYTPKMWHVTFLQPICLLLVFLSSSTLLITCPSS